MKTCYKCKLSKAEESFARNKSKKDGLSAQCRSCQATYLKSHYTANKAYYMDKAALRHKAEATWLNDYKSTKPCADCGRTFPAICMDFDHIGTDKTANVSALVSYGRSILRAEIAKCELVCACCHRLRTKIRQMTSSCSITDNADGF